jgi:predicted dehydrogenase
MEPVHGRRQEGRVQVRIGVVGTENSHAEEFVRYFNLAQRFAGHRIVALADGPAERNLQLAELGGISTVADHAADLIGAVDAVIVCSRDGRRHLGQSLPLLEASLPVFVDKPMACSVADAQAMLDAAGRNGVAISSFSALRWTSEVTALASRINAGRGSGAESRTRTIAVTGPADPSSEHGGIHFYGVHVVEIALALAAGKALTEISVEDRGDEIAATARSGEVNILLEFVRPRPEPAVTPWRVVISGAHGSSAHTLALGPEYDLPATAQVVRMFESGHRPLTDGELLAPVEALVAVEQALAAQPSG